ncbi:MAG: DNA polymerase III subunit alpha, partial [Pseudomonadota bacterium]
MSETQPFLHLRVHSAYSLLEGALKIAKLVELAKADNVPALALTDSNNLFGALEFSEAVSGAGIQPIIGCTLNLTFEKPSKSPGSPEAQCQTPDGAIALLAKNEAGYGNLMELSSRAYANAAETGEAFASIDDLTAHSEGLIALTGGPEGLVDTAFADGNAELAGDRISVLHEIFGDRLYIELQRHGLAHEKAVEPQLVQTAYERKIPLVATNEPFFATADDFEAHDALICIAQGSYVAVDERRRLSPEHYFKTADEMRALFADLPEAIENTAEIAQRCAYRPKKHDPILPAFLSGGEANAVLAETEAAELKRQAEEGLDARLAQHGPAAGSDEAAYRERLGFELEIITRMNYQGYFLIVSDFIKWTKGQGIPVGPGRGSGAGSLVAYALTITDLDPIRFGLLFERFLNPERVSMPDFDIDFCQDRRDEVIAYVRDRYGEHRVAQIITFGKLQARAVLRDVGRVLQMPYGQVDRLCKLVPNNPANPVTLPQAIAGEPRLQEERDKEPIVAKLLDIGQRLEGLYRHASTHAAGVVIADRTLTELVPLYRDARAQLPATQFNMKWAEAAGLVKFDFLGLKTLTVIDMA